MCAYAYVLASLPVVIQCLVFWCALQEFEVDAEKPMPHVQPSSLQPCENMVKVGSVVLRSFNVCPATGAIIPVGSHA